MFEDVRRAFRDLLHGNTNPEERRSVLADMRDTLVRARMGVDDLRKGVSETRARLETERRELETVRRRKTLAQGINDAETVTVAERFEKSHGELVTVLERKLESQEAELELVSREVEEMTRELKSASAGVGSGRTARSPESIAADPLEDANAGLRQEIDQVARQQRRAAKDADADERLAALKRRMGR